MAGTSKENKLINYKRCFLCFLQCAHPSILRGSEIPRAESLLVITPETIIFLLYILWNARFWAYYPVLLRSNTLKYYKKATSSFMPRRKPYWDPIRLEGNPTMSEDVNDMIEEVIKLEVRGLGKHISREGRE